MRRRFVQGVKQSEEKLQHVSFRARCVCTSTTRAFGKADTREYEVGIRGPNGLQAGVRDGVSFVQARNDTYAFALHRSAAGSSLQFVESVGVGPSIDARIAAMEQPARAMALAAYYLWTEPLARAVDRESFEIKRVYAVPSEDREFVRVEFDYGIDDPSQKIHDRFTDGYVVCDPARQWTVKEYGAVHHNLSNDHVATLKTVLEHGDAIGEMPVATKITQTMASRDNGYTSESVISLSILRRDLADEELHLTHYGLPEPNFSRSWFGAWIWCLLAGIICLVVAIVVRRRRVIGVCVLVLAFTGGEAWSQEDDSAMRGRLLAAVAKAENKCRRAPGSIHVKAITTTQLSPKTVDADYSPELLAKLRQESANLTKPRIVATSEYAGRSDLQLEMGTRDGFEFVTARNRRYAFHIQRAPELKGYSLQFLQRIGGDPAVDALIDEAALRSVVATRSLAWSMFGKRLWEWIDSPDFKIEGTSEVQSGAETLVRIDFEHLVDEVRPGRPCLSDGYLICDPAADWALREFEASFINPVQGVAVTRQRGSLEYAETTKRLPLPIPETISLSTNWINDAKNTDWTITTLEVISTDVPEEIFYLSHYGLPEPTFRRSWLGTWVWYLAAGIVCLIVAAAIFKRRTARWRW